ncbi:branched-chain amino acid ABC transporter permease [Pseudolysinimonas sp.]|uniref:branched-chain amino acid ABC transporter permease n=1 Tax=Pseudolysinimonas sp. TaxID=2680009 RepID=UPI003F80178A
MLDLVLQAVPTDDSWINLDFTAFVQGFWSNTFGGLTYGAVYGLIALGYTLVYGVLNLINFAHSEVFISGVYAVVFTLTGLGFNGDPPGLAWPALIGDLLLALLAGMIASAVVAFLVERVAYRTLRRKNPPRLVYLITAIGVSFTIQYLFFLWRGAQPEPSVILLPTVPVFDIFGGIVYNFQIVIIVAAIVTMIAVDQFIRRSRTGRGIRAVAQDPDTATLMGVNRERIIVITFIIGGLVAGVGAIAWIMLVPQGAQYNGGFILGVKAFAAAVLGGIGNVRGALLGGLLIGLIGNYGQTLLGASEWSDVVAFVVLVVVLIVRPTGILGQSMGRSRA